MHAIRLTNTVFEGENAVYVLDGDGPLTLIDAGVATENGRSQLRAGLADAGHEVADVEQVLLTHWHHDHSGLAGWLQAERGATVRIHAADAPLFEPGGFERFSADREDSFREWGMPAAEREGLREFFAGFTSLVGEPVDVTPIEEGDRLRAGDRDLEVWHLPGHAAGLVGFVDDERNEAFVGDAILPRYTPNVGGADVRVEDPLGTYLETLARLESAGLARAYPGHRDPIDDPAGRAREIIAHHEERTERVRAVLEREGQATAWEVSAALFGDLEGIHVMHGPGEAFAHLDHLRRRGVVERDGRRYALR